jgi:hypothetical protein
MAEQIFMKRGMYNVAPEKISFGYYGQDMVLQWLITIWCLTGFSASFTALETLTIIWVYFPVKHNSVPINSHFTGIIEFVGRIMPLHVSVHGAISRQYINKPYTIELYILYGSIYCIYHCVLQ